MDGDLRAEFRADKVLEAVCVCETERDWGKWKWKMWKRGRHREPYMNQTFI